jgi:DNA-binding response OmpR family regulator
MAQHDSERIEHLGVAVDRAGQRAFAGNQELKLTGTEFRLLAQLLGEPGRTFTRAELIKTVIAGGVIVLPRTIDKHIQALRAKLGRFDLIETVRGVGYRFRAAR